MPNSEELAHMRRIHAHLKALGIRHAFIGGWAAVAWGVVRATRDIDLIADIPATARDRVTKGLEEAGHAPEWRGLGDLTDPIPLLLRLSPRSAGEPGVDIEDARGMLRVQGDKIDQAILSAACKAREVLPILKKLRERL